jgi:hypothetical protein
MLGPFLWALAQAKEGTARLQLVALVSRKGEAVPPYKWHCSLVASVLMLSR